jgi:hypothetical protein
MKPVAVAVSLQFLIAIAFCLAVLLAILNRFDVRGSAAAAAVFAYVMLIVAIFFRSVDLFDRRGAMMVMAFLIVPAAIEFAVSRAAWLQSHPWWLLGAGPLSFLVAATVSMVAFNVFTQRASG